MTTQIDPDHQYSPKKSFVTKVEGCNCKIVLFTIYDVSTKKGMTYGVNVEQVREIASKDNITRVPGAPAHVIGVMNLRGKIITLIDTKRLLGFKTGGNLTKGYDTDGNDKVIVAQVRKSTIGLLVDGVDEVTQISQSDIEPAPTVLCETAPYIKGIVKKNDELYVIIDLELLLEMDKDGAEDGTVGSKDFNFALNGKADSNTTAGTAGNEMVEAKGSAKIQEPKSDVHTR